MESTFSFPALLFVAIIGVVIFVALSQVLLEHHDRDGTSGQRRAPTDASVAIGTRGRAAAAVNESVVPTRPSATSVAAVER